MTHIQGLPTIKLSCILRRMQVIYTDNFSFVSYYFMILSYLFERKEALLAIQSRLSSNSQSSCLTLLNARIIHEQSDLVYVDKFKCD